MAQAKQSHYDFVIIGSGFGGSVSALRLSEKGYKVLVIEKGKWLDAEDFPTTNWDLKKWLWVPSLKFHGLFKMSFFRHVGVLSGVGVGGGSLVYANTLPIPKKAFYETGSWAGLANWENELEVHYETALKMLGAEKNPSIRKSDRVILELAKKLDKEKDFDTTNVAVYFGKPGETVPDPYFDGKGPERTGCIQCGGCMLGCRYNSKNTLDKNYLWLAQQLGTEIVAEVFSL
jgi:cholesterol oxidase